MLCRKPPLFGIELHKYRKALRLLTHPLCLLRIAMQHKAACRHRVFQLFIEFPVPYHIRGKTGQLRIVILERQKGISRMECLQMIDPVVVVADRF